MKGFQSSGREQYNVEDYSFSQTTLEQVFINFAKQQELEDETDEKETTRSMDSTITRLDVTLKPDKMN